MLIHKAQLKKPAPGKTNMIEMTKLKMTIFQLNGIGETLTVMILLET